MTTREKFIITACAFLLIIPHMAATKSYDLYKHSYSYATIDGGYTKVTGADWNNTSNSYVVRFGFGHKFPRTGFHFGPEIHINLEHITQTTQSKNSFFIIGVGPAFKYMFQYKEAPLVPFIGIMPAIYLRKGDIKTFDTAGAEVSKENYRFADMGINGEGGIGYLITSLVMMSGFISYSMIIEPRQKNIIPWYTYGIRFYFIF